MLLAYSKSVHCLDCDIFQSKVCLLHKLINIYKSSVLFKSYVIYTENQGFCSVGLSSLPNFISWGEKPQLCLQLIRLSSHGSLRMLMRCSTTTPLNPQRSASISMDGWTDHGRLTHTCMAQTDERRHNNIKPVAANMASRAHCSLFSVTQLALTTMTGAQVALDNQAV